MAQEFGLTSTRGATRSVRCRMRLLCTLSALAASAVAALGQTEGLKATLTALGDRTVATLGSQSPAVRGASDVATADAPLKLALAAPAGVTPQAALRLSLGAAGDATIFVESATIEIRERSDAAAEVNIAFEGGAAGTVDVYSALPEPAVLLITTAGGNVLLPRGNVRVKSSDGGIEISTSSGKAAVSGGALPDGGVKALAGGQSLDAGAVNRIMLQAGGKLSEGKRVEDLSLAMARFRGGVVQRSLLPDLVKQAEAVAEGDIEPPTRGTKIAAAIAIEIRIPEIVPRGGIVQAIVSGARSATTAAARSTAEAFAGSQNAAEALIGARLLRTRVVGAPAGSSVPLTISNQIRRPFTLGP